MKEAHASAMKELGPTADARSPGAADHFRSGVVTEANCSVAVYGNHYYSCTFGRSDGWCRWAIGETISIRIRRNLLMRVWKAMGSRLWSGETVMTYNVELLST